MTMSERYGVFYRTELAQERFVDVNVKGWPRNRSEAILAHAGRGQAVLDVGCGNGQLLNQLRMRFKQLVGIKYLAHRLEQARVNLNGPSFLALQGSAFLWTSLYLPRSVGTQSTRPIYLPTYKC